MGKTCRTGIACIIAFLLFFSSISIPGFKKFINEVSAAESNYNSVLQNPSFESASNGIADHWAISEGSYTVDTVAENVYDGSRSIHLQNTVGENTNYGIYQTIHLNRTSIAPVKISGWSKAEGISGTHSPDVAAYSIWVDLLYDDDTSEWGHARAFDTGLDGWQFIEFTINPIKPIKSLTINGLFRGIAGEVWFDDFNVQEFRTDTVQNPSFETVSGNHAANWAPLNLGYTLDSANAKSGSNSIYMENNTGAGSQYGASQTITLNRSVIAPIKFGGWSKAEGVAGSPSINYSIWVDIEYNDGTPLWGQIVTLNTGTHDWQYAEYTINPEKPVKRLTINALFKDTAGKVWFDDFKVEEYPFEEPAIPADNLLQNSDLGNMADGAFTGWNSWLAGYSVANTEGLGGSRGAKIVRESGQAAENGIYQELMLNREEALPLLISGWSKALDVDGNISSDYSLYADIVYNDGTEGLGYHVQFDVGTHGWQYKTLYIEPEKPIKSIKIFGIFRNHTGTVWFDNIVVEELDSVTAYNVIPTDTQGIEKVTNGSMEITNGNLLNDWNPFGKGYSLDNGGGRNGTTGVMMENTSATDEGGMYTGVGLYQTTPRLLAISGWSKAEEVDGEIDNGYAIYMDIAFADGTWLNAKTISFMNGTHDWQQRMFYYNPPKPVSAIYLYALFSRHTGKVWFDDFSIREITTGAELQNAMVTQVNERPQNAYTTLETEDGLSLSLGDNGIASLKQDNVELKVPGVPSGFLIRDQAADSNLYAFRRTGAGTANEYKGRVEDLGLEVDADFEELDNAIKVTGRLTDTTQSDRAVTLSFALPVNASGWVWDDYIRQSRVIRPYDEAYTYSNNDQPDFETGPLSLYPTTAIYDKASGKSLALAVDYNKPTHYKLDYNRGTKQLLITFEFGLSPDTANFPSSADFSFVIYRFDPEWGFRSSFDKYTELFPEFYTVRSKEQGIWMPFASIADIPNWQDFGFQYKEGDDNDPDRQFHIDNDIDDFNYTEPSTWWQKIDQNLPQTIETAISEREIMTEEGFLPAQMAVVAGMKNALGNPILQMVQTPWTNGARWMVNSNPDLKNPDYPDYPNGYELYYSDEILERRYGGADAMDGEYLDTLDGWPYTLDYERGHFGPAKTPLVYSSITKQPAVHRAFAAWELVKKLSDRMHGMDKMMMSNGTPYSYSMYMPWLDIMGNERNWLGVDHSYNPDPDYLLSRFRTLSAQKPYNMLQNTDFAHFTNEYMELYMQRLLFYGIYPSAFSKNASENNYWITPEYYNRDRELFKKYVPIVEEVAEAGWESITYATSNHPEVYVERYGKGSTVYLTVMNDSKTTGNTATIKFDPEEMGLNGDLVITEMISGSEIDFENNEFEIEMNSNQTMAFKIGRKLEPNPGGGHSNVGEVNEDNGTETSVNDGVIVVKPKATSGSLAFAITKAQIDKAIVGATSDYVVILMEADIRGPIRLELPTGAIAALQESGKGLKIVTPPITIQYPPGALPVQARAGDGTIRLFVGTGQGGSVDNQVANVIKGDKSMYNTTIVYELELNYVGSDGTITPIREFDKAVTVTRTLTDKELAGLDRDMAGVYYLNGREAVYMGGTFNGNEVIFNTTHFSSYAILEYRKTFADTDNHWAKGFISKLAARHAIEGVDGTRFLPDNAVTRADFAVVAVKALGFFKLVPGSPKFSDVASDKYYAAYVHKAHELGLVTGFDGRFRPEETITREEAAVILMRLHDYLNKDKAEVSDEDAFTDIADASHWARSAIADAKALRFVSGKGGGRFDPQADVTRAEIAKMIWLSVNS
ncbi:hypothetical protein B1748_16825 [Paenibacillus sp. MY03]|uniref:S-layer homology domain-containing protein n=1 Tax=Paenibacillus sp. MY03 TaxID=302980 RepID=UPI000B3CC308|nr:S-layer homology domain-containing protein [Paenibacillus sp. MY03]OUS75525.1 hypothetical protein B1748_16825 [Paenibacillus sp. MY03]